MKKNWKILAIAALVIVAVILLFIKKPAPPPVVVPTLTSTTAPVQTLTAALTPINLKDGLGRMVTLSAPAQRIVSMAPSTTEILFSIGAGGQVIGRDSFSSYPASATEIQDVGGSMGNYSFETIASLEPDLVVLAEINTPEQVKSLEDLGLTVYYVANPTDLDGLYPILQSVGQLSGHSVEAEALIASLKDRVKDLLELAAKAETKPTIFYELDGSDPAKPWTAGPGTFVDILISLAGGENVGGSLESAWAQISIEALLVADPDIILLGDSNYGVTAEQVSARAGWGDLTAVKEGKVFGYNDDLVSRPGPRLVDGLKDLVALIHPELMK